VSHQLYDVWAETPTSPKTAMFGWKAQLINFVGIFKTEELAHKYVDAVRKLNKKGAKCVTKGQ